MVGERPTHLHKQRIPPQTRTTEDKNIERIKKNLERTERYAAREKYRRDTELYGDVFYNWDLIMQQELLKGNEKERNQKIAKQEKLRATWGLQRFPARMGGGLERGNGKDKNEKRRYEKERGF